MSGSMQEFTGPVDPMIRYPAAPADRPGQIPVGRYGLIVGGVHRQRRPVGADNPVTSCDLHVFVDEAAEPVSS